LEIKWMGAPAQQKICRVLCLDGGGAKGFYTLGALRETEALIGSRLCERFDLIFGTSTGAIIAALLGLGKSVDEIEALYRRHVVAVMARWLPSQRTAALESLSAEVFEKLKFDAFKTDMGIVGTRWKEERPIIFKTDRRQAFLGKATFEPGFGCTIGDAVVGSCSAYPLLQQEVRDDRSRHHIILGHGASLLQWRSGGFEPPRYAALPLQAVHQLPRIARWHPSDLIRTTAFSVRLQTFVLHRLRCGD
jgi:uncharacterized protein